VHTVQYSQFCFYSSENHLNGFNSARWESAVLYCDFCLTANKNKRFFLQFFVIRSPPPPQNEVNAYSRRIMLRCDFPRSVEHKLGEVTSLLWLPTTGLLLVVAEDGNLKCYTRQIIIFIFIFILDDIIRDCKVENIYNSNNSNFLLDCEQKKIFKLFLNICTRS
jgi:hypothetical protein